MPALEPTLYVIGGPARCGKSTLARIARRSLDVAHMPGDAIKAALDITGWLDDLPPIDDENGTIEEWLAAIRVRDARVTEFAAVIFDRGLHVEQTHLLVDGVYWPDHVAALELNTRAVYIIDTRADHAEHLLAIRDSSGKANNWQRDPRWDEHRIRHWARYNVARSNLYAEIAHAAGFTVVDLAEHTTLDSAGAAALEVLLAS